MYKSNIDEQNEIRQAYAKLFYTSKVIEKNNKKYVITDATEDSLIIRPVVGEKLGTKRKLSLRAYLKYKELGGIEVPQEALEQRADLSGLMNNLLNKVHMRRGEVIQSFCLDGCVYYVVLSDSECIHIVLDDKGKLLRYNLNSTVLFKPNLYKGKIIKVLDKESLNKFEIKMRLMYGQHKRTE